MLRKPKLTIGMDLGDRSSRYCLLDEAGEVLLEQKATHDSRKQFERCLGPWRDVGSRWRTEDALAVGESTAE